ncbi:MAG: hypothetical protein OEQ13_10405 [Acidobacteriota bacterium]|nr:hypothetical protein [Acidobacteriota bacterium]
MRRVSRTPLLLAATVLVVLASSPVLAKKGKAAPRPDVWIAAPVEDVSTNADSLEILVGFAAWVDPMDPMDVGNVHDIDLLLNGQIVDTRKNRPSVKTGTVSFELSLAGLPPGTHEIQARACQGSRRARHWGASRVVRIFRGCLWPNGASRANSDPWIAANHDAICGMEPRLLVLNFSNDTSMEKAARLARELKDALAESSRWHGYENPSAPAFLNYQVDKIVDLRDDSPVETCDGNSTRYPRVPDWTSGINFVYSELYTDAFAADYGYPDPSNPSRFLTLGELVNRGMIHELWFFANHRACGAPLETVELKQYYDENFEPVTRTRRKRPRFRHPVDRPQPAHHVHQPGSRCRLRHGELRPRPGAHAAQRRHPLLHALLHRVRRLRPRRPAWTAVRLVLLVRGHR